MKPEQDVTNKQSVRRYVDMGLGQICPINNMRESAVGDYILYKDYEALQTERDTLVKALQIIRQEEPVGRVVTVGGYPDESEHTVEWLCKYKDLKDGDLLYSKPQPVEQQPEPDTSESKAKTPKESWWAGYRAGKGLPADTPRQDAIATPDVSALVDLLRDIGDVCRQLEMPSERTIAEWADRIDAALAAPLQTGQPAQPCYPGGVCGSNRLDWR